MAKRKVNLTIDDAVFERAKRAAKKRGESVSAVVERFLGQFAGSPVEPDDHWLTAFHKKYLPLHHREPTDEELEQMRYDHLMEKYK